jgi:hypothetical protein
MPWDQILDRVALATGRTPALGDSTGLGDPVVDFLQKKLGGGEASTFQGYHFTPASKQKLMEGLAIAIQSRGVGYPDGVIVEELEQFEFVFTRTGVRYSAPEGYYDDCVCALALAQMCRTTVPAGMSISPEIIAQVGTEIASGAEWSLDGAGCNARCNSARS